MEFRQRVNTSIASWRRERGKPSLPVIGINLTHHFSMDLPINPDGHLRLRIMRLCGGCNLAANRIVSESGIRQGYALVLGSAEGRLAYELARQTELQVVVVEPDAAKAQAAGHGVERRRDCTAFAPACIRAAWRICRTGRTSRISSSRAVCSLMENCRAKMRRNCCACCVRRAAWRCLATRAANFRWR